MTDAKKSMPQDETHEVEHGTTHELPPAKPSTQPPQDLFDSGAGEVDFRGVSWQSAAILIAKFQIGLGALSLPGTFHVLGFFPGILCFIVLAIITTISGYLCGNARQYYPHIHSISDAAEILFGKGARELIGVIYYIYLALVAGAGMLTTSVALNALSNHETCTMVFVAVTCAAAFIIRTGFRSLEKVAWISWIGVAGIVFAIWITAIAVLAQSRPAAAPPGPIVLNIQVLPKATFSQAMAAVSSQLFALGASGTFFYVSAEMKRPEQFTRALICGQTFIVITNIAISSIIYGKIGQYLASPALGSAGPVVKKVSYRIALPGLLVTAVLWSHIAAKYWFVRILRGTRHLQSNTVVHWAVWIGSMLATVVFAFIVVGVVPFFDEFLSLVGALVNPVFTNIVPGFMLFFFLARRPVKVDGLVRNGGLEAGVTVSARRWLLESFGAYRRGWKEAIAFGTGIFMIQTGAFIIVGGTYATVLSIQQSYDKGRVSGVFSCADNSV
ncbi:transmembrane amino acid transporter protein-domain-containing protein [Aspergillus karnatakaensis]|uniref:transmembrane amino acid transporter protein-domain-containing protein n=1 Tax=Aspergillus karnatakaensis TaxID=1810916 RepID=UPI003CCCF4EE